MIVNAASTAVRIPSKLLSQIYFIVLSIVDIMLDMVDIVLDTNSFIPAKSAAHAAAIAATTPIIANIGGDNPAIAVPIPDITGCNVVNAVTTLPAIIIKGPSAATTRPTVTIACCIPGSRLLKASTIFWSQSTAACMYGNSTSPTEIPNNSKEFFN